VDKILRSDPMEAKTINLILKSQEDDIQNEAFLPFEEKIKILIEL
jgi:hypothetical protein